MHVYFKIFEENKIFFKPFEIYLLCGVLVTVQLEYFVIDCVFQ